MCCEFLSVQCIWLYVIITYAFQKECTLCSCMNVKEFLARNRRDIWSLSDSNWIRTYNHLVCKWTLNHLAIFWWVNGKWKFTILNSLNIRIKIWEWSLRLWLFTHKYSEYFIAAICNSVAKIKRDLQMSKIALLSLSNNFILILDGIALS